MHYYPRWLSRLFSSAFCYTWLLPYTRRLCWSFWGLDLRATFASLRSFVPSVVEPSFGIGRIMYCMFEHCWFTREQDKQRAVFRFTPPVAPTKATVFPLIQRPEMNGRAREISASLTRAGVSNIIDTTGNGVMAIN